VEENERTFSFKSPRYIMPKVFEKNGLLERRVEVYFNYDRHSFPDSTNHFVVNEQQRKLTFYYYDSGKVKESICDIQAAK
jgi:hypothetical protein